MEAKGRPRDTKMRAKDSFWGAQRQLNGPKCEPEAPREEPLGVLDRISEQPEWPNSKNLKKDTLCFPIFPPKIHQKTVQKHTKTHQIINRKKYTFFQRFFIDLTTFFIDFSKQFLIEFPNLEKIPHLTICSKIFEWIEGRGSRFSLKIAIQIYWKSIQKAIQFFNDFSMILEGFRASFWEAKRGQGRPWKQDQKRYEKSKVRPWPGIAKTCLVGFAPL